jgi:DNA polymerase-3 subunit beta
MKIECVKLHLKDALQIAERFTGKQLALPVLKYVLLIAGEKSLHIRATNLDLGIEIELPARIEKEGVMAVPADTLANFLSNLPDEKNVRIEQIGEHLTISGSSYSTLIKGYGYEDFPTLPFVTKGTSLTVESRSLLALFRSTQFAVATTDVKPEFSSIYLYTDDRSLIAAATDSSRLAEKRINLKKTPEELHLLIPGKSVAMIIRAIEQLEGMIEMVATKNQVSFHAEHTHVTCRLIDGIFPDYSQIIPKHFMTEAVVLRQDFLDRIKLATVFSGKLERVRIKIDPEEKIFEIESKSDDIGETTNQIDATLKGERVEFLFNQRYLFDVLSHLSTDSIALSAAGPGKPLVIKGVSDPTFLYLIMPMRG